MSGITGIFRRDGKDVDPSDIKKMNDKIAHRGPDGSKVWCEGPVAFGHQMLHTTPESLHEILPFEDEESGLVITADARIDNREDLAPKLGIEDNEHVSDSYFILKAYEKWGEKCPEELLGDFAFAIWDKNRETLFCARDHMGVKPFYYYLSDDVFLFSTEMKAIHCFNGVPYTLNKLVAAFYLIPCAEETHSTFYKEITRLPGAHSLILNQSKLNINQYWELNPNIDVKMDSDEDYIIKFRELFNEAIQCRLRCSFKIGFELSGGLDSSSIVSVAKDILKKNNYPLQTFSLVTNDFPKSDERFYINKLFETGDIERNFLFVDQISPLNSANEISWHLEQPLYSSNASFFWELHKKMQKKDIRVLFKGYDGDSVLSHSQKYFKELFLKFQWEKLIKETCLYSKNVNKDPFHIFLNQSLYSLVPYHIKKVWHKFKQIKEEGDFVLNNKLNRELNILQKYKPYQKSSINPNTAKEFHYELIVQGSHQFAFEYNDRFTSAFLIEPRYPFFDKRLVEFCYGIPNEQKFNSGWDRMILRKAIYNLPDEIKWRSNKKFLTPVFQRNLLELEQRRIEEVIFEKKYIYDKFVDPADVIKLYQQYKLKPGSSQISDPYDVWKIVTLVLWLENKNNLIL